MCFLLFYFFSILFDTRTSRTIANILELEGDQTVMYRKLDFIISPTIFTVITLSVAT